MKKVLHLTLIFLFIPAVLFAVNPFEEKQFNDSKHPTSIQQPQHKKTNNEKSVPLPPPPLLEKRASKWQVKGRIYDKVVLINEKDETRVVTEGEEFEGCIVTEEKLLCTEEEKKTFTKTIKNEDRYKDDGSAAKDKEIQSLKDKIGLLQKNIASLSGEVSKKEQTVRSLLEAVVVEKIKHSGSEDEAAMLLEDCYWIEVDTEGIPAQYVDAGSYGVFKVSVQHRVAAERIFGNTAIDRWENPDHLFFVLAKNDINLTTGEQKR